jgi:hypothetical protein
MKKISKFFALLLVAGLISICQLNAQSNASVYAYEDVAELSLGSDFQLPTSVYNYVETSSGNYTINATWYLSDGNMYIPEKGTNKVMLVAYLNHSGGIGDPFIGVLGVNSIGDEEMQVEGEATINKHGKCHVVFHVNANQ